MINLMIFNDIICVINRSCINEMLYLAMTMKESTTTFPNEFSNKN